MDEMQALIDKIQTWNREYYTLDNPSVTDAEYDAAYDRLAGAGAELVTTEMVAFEWLRSCEHPAFKDMLALVK